MRYVESFISRISDDPIYKSRRFMALQGIERPVSRDYIFGMLRIAKIRKSKKVRQEELAAEIGTSQSNISEIENGKHNPTLETLSKIASALDANIIELFEPSQQSEAMTRFVSAYDLLEQDEREQIVKLAEMMASRKAH